MGMQIPAPGEGVHGGTLDETANPTDKPKRKRTTRVNRTVQDVRSADIHNTGRLLPMAPTTAADLVEQWQIPEVDCYHARVNVFRQTMGEDSVQLLESVPVLEYDLGKMAGKYGPGRYYIKGTPRQYAMNSARFDVSEELARSNGYGRLPTRAADITAARTLERATAGPVDPVDLLAAVEAMMDRKLKEAGMQGQAAPGVMMNPMEAMQRQMESFYSFMGFMDKMETRAVQLAERRAGLRGADEPVEPASTTLQIIQALAPMAGPILERIMSGPRLGNPPAAAPAQPATLAGPTPATTGGPTVATVTKPELTDEEKATIAPAVTMLGPYAGHLSEAIKREVSDRELAESLGGYIPPNLYGSIIGLSDVVRMKGVGVLAYISDTLTNPRWPAVLSELAAMLKTVEEQ